MSEEAFIEDCYFDPVADGGSNRNSPEATSLFAIDSDEELDVDADGWVAVQKQSDLIGNDRVAQLRAVINENDCDPGMIRKILAGRIIGKEVEDRKDIRKKIWPALLGVGKRKVGPIDNESDEVMESVFDRLGINRESIPVATLFCRSRGIDITEPIGDWVHLLKPISELKIEIDLQYIILHPISTRLTPQLPKSLKAACEVILLLVQYHKPNIGQQLSDLRLDSFKAFSPLLSSLFACNYSESIPALWDAIFQLNEPIISVFLITILIINCEEELNELQTSDNFHEMLNTALNKIEETDVTDFLDLALQYRDITPRTYIEERIMPLFTPRPSSYSLLSSLCVEVSPSEAILSVAMDPSSLNFVLFDVRPAEQFNQCHLRSTMHLEADSGEKVIEQITNHIEVLQMIPEDTHVLLIGDSDNDPDVYCFVSQLLKQGRNYVSIINGGFNAISQHIYTPDSHLDPTEWFLKADELPQNTKRTFRSFNSFSKLKNSFQSIDTKKIGDRIKAGFETILSEAETGLGLKPNKHYKGRAPVFAIDDDSESDDNKEEQLNMETFLKRKDLKGHWDATGAQNKSFILVLSNSQLITIQPGPDNWAKIKSRRPLHQINRITSKKKCSELITFRYNDSTKDCFYIHQAEEATREIKRQVVAVLDVLGLKKEDN